MSLRVQAKFPHCLLTRDTALSSDVNNNVSMQTRNLHDCTICAAAESDKTLQILRSVAGLLH